MDITQSKDFTRKGIEKISRSVRAYAYLVLASRVQARSRIEFIGIDIERYQGVLEHALSKVDFSVDTGITCFQAI